MERFKKRIIKSLLIYAIIVFIAIFLTYPPGEKLSFYKYGEKMDYPITSQKPTGRWEEYTAYYFTKRPVVKYIVLPRIEAQGLELYANWKRVFKIGGENSNSKIWAKTFSVPVYFKSGENEITLRLWGLSRLSITVPVVVTKNPHLYTITSDVIYVWFPTIMAPSIMMMGVFFLVMSGRTMQRRHLFFFLGMAMLFIGTHMFHYCFLPYLGDTRLYSFVNKVLYSALFASLSFYYSAIEAILGKMKLWKWIMPAGLITALFILLSPNLYKALKLTITLLTPILLVVIIYGLVQLIKYQNYYFAPPTLILTISSLQFYFSYIHNLNLQPVLVFGISYMAYSFLYFLITELENLSKERIKAYTDPLTGAYNRRILEKLELEKGDIFVFFDIDGMKDYNDIRGHDYGDAALVDFAKTVKRNIKGKDCLIRYGGDEFIVIMKDCRKEDAEDIAKSIDREYRSKRGLGVSYGIATYDGDVKETIKRADKKMYEMKEKKKTSE